MARLLRFVAAMVLCGAVAGCGGGRSGSSLTPLDVARYVAVKQSTDGLTRLILFVGSADTTASELVQKPAGSSQAQSLAQGVDLSWNNVVVVLNGFTPAEAAAVPELTKVVLNYKALATNWQHAAEAIAEHGGHPPHGTIRSWLRPVQKQEQQLRPLLASLAATLAAQTCTLQRAHQELAEPSAKAQSCAVVKRLKQQTQS